MICLHELDSSERMQVGFSTLRGLVMQRPTMRSDALSVLLELTTHPGQGYSFCWINIDKVKTEKKTRGAAINTVKLWVPNTQPMEGIIRDFALQTLRKLQSPVSPKQLPKTEPKPHSDDEEIVNGDTIEVSEDQAPPPSDDGQVDEENMEDGQLPADDLVHTPYLPERIQLPADKAQVLQHVELLFVLSVKVPEFLDE